MTYNNLINLPDEKLLLNKFPDLKVRFTIHFT
ncbi:hypothetical protein TELCIR_20175 [Teladorsagia circumcincta]|uniref:Uncharacterized protein n=1 Tax=Teladorsagia circumcincta TaxID=45464 RepID=A0A2G9TK98_TELCI|nr:hypothetical protein TELCIR_20175 [Teladorsagia circumcincta]